MKYFGITILCIVALFFVKCTEPSVVGSNLVENDFLKLEFTDTVSITAKTIAGDSILIYNDSSGFRSLLRYLVGNLEDPLFGNSAVTTYGQLRLEAENKSYEEFFIDSVFLTMIYSEEGHYGDKEKAMNIKVFELAESLKNVGQVYSNESFEENIDPIGVLDNYFPDPNKPFLQIDSSGEFLDTMELDSRIRIPINNEFGAKILNLDSVTLSSNDLFLDALNGISIRAGLDDNQLLAFDLLNPETELTIFFKADGQNQEFNLIFSNESIKTIQYDTELAGSFVSDFLNDEEKGDSLLFFQGNSGVNVEFQIPHLNSLGEILINNAELEIIVASLDIDDPNAFSPMKYLTIKYLNDNGGFTDVPDKTFADIISGFDNDARHFGGFIEEWEDGGMTMYKYSVNLSTYVQELVEENEVPILYIQSRLQQIDASRTVIYGPGHSKYPMKIKLTYTRK